MKPILFTLLGLPVSSFGFFIMLSFLTGLFVIWRTAKASDFDTEKVIDTVLLSFFSGLLGARIYFIILAWPLYDSLEKFIFLNKFPGLSISGGFLGGALALWLISKRSKLNFWQVVDTVVVGLAIALALGDFGCFFNGCAVGKVSGSWLALNTLGYIGKRIPVTLIEGLSLLLTFWYLKKMSFRFHFAGKITAFFMIFYGAIKYASEYWKDQTAEILNLPVTKGQFLSFVLVLVGLVVYYRQSRRKVTADLRNIVQLAINPKKQKLLLLTLNKSCYNFQVNSRVKLHDLQLALKGLPKFIREKLHVKPTPANY